MKDYLIIGNGIAGICFAETVLNNNKTCNVISNSSQNSSLVAAGIYNPVILKRFSIVWNAAEQLIALDIFYNKIENKLNLKINSKIPVLRKFFSKEEQNNWFVAADKPLLEPFLANRINNTQISSINSIYGYGEVLKTGFVNTSILITEYQKYLNSLSIILKDTFDYNKLVINDSYITYNDLKAKQIVFCEGFGLEKNPYFNYLPLDGTKGELITIKAPNLNCNFIINASIFILPLGKNIYKVGATYNWEDKTNIPTSLGLLELETKLQETINCDYELLKHEAGVRPTVKDRKPLVGTHKLYKNVHILNGLGTRGVMLGPSLALNLFENIEYGKPLFTEVTIDRFNKKN